MYNSNNIVSPSAIELWQWGHKLIFFLEETFFHLVDKLEYRVFQTVVFDPKVWALMEEIVNFTIVFCINLNTYEFKRTVQLQPIELTSVSIKNQGILYSQSKFLWCTLLISHKHTQFDRYEDFTYDARLIFISPDWFRWPLQKKDSNAI